MCVMQVVSLHRAVRCSLRCASSIAARVRHVKHMSDSAWVPCIKYMSETCQICRCYVMKHCRVLKSSWCVCICMSSSTKFIFTHKRSTILIFTHKRHVSGFGNRLGKWLFACLHPQYSYSHTRYLEDFRTFLTFLCVCVFLCVCCVCVCVFVCMLCRWSAHRAGSSHVIWTLRPSPWPTCMGGRGCVWVWGCVCRYVCMRMKHIGVVRRKNVWVTHKQECVLSKVLIRRFRRVCLVVRILCAKRVTADTCVREWVECVFRVRVEKRYVNVERDS